MNGIWSSKGANSGTAYVTLLTNDAYAPGVRALVRSLAWSRTQSDIVVLHTGGVGGGVLESVDRLGARLVETALLEVSTAFADRHARKTLHTAAPFNKGGKPAFHTPLDNFCKLRLWQLADYERCVFIDADAIVVRNIDKLFGYPEFSAAPNVYETVADFHRLNSGVFVATPDNGTFEAMMARLDQPDAFWRRTDQTFLETFFPDWQGLPVFYNLLQYVWFNLPALWRWDSVKVVHYQYEKPWEENHPKTDVLKPLIDLWNIYHDGAAPPDLSALATPALS